MLETMLYLILGICPSFSLFFVVSINLLSLLIIHYTSLDKGDFTISLYMPLGFVYFRSFLPFVEQLFAASVFHCPQR